MWAPTMIRAVGVVVAAAALTASGEGGGAPAGPAPKGPGPAYVGNQACLACHHSIQQSYSRTAMARTSGPALPNLIEGSFRHAPSGVEYRVFKDDDRALLSYARSQDPNLNGTQLLKYYVGSNTRGRTFLFEIDGFLYQAPLNYYAEKKLWDMSPGYEKLKEMELNHSVTPSCLFCHASGVQPNVRGTLNRFGGDVFRQDGVGCERCHGPGGDHVKGNGPMINPARLTGERRDGVCFQCHLEGQAGILKPGKRLEDYRPGERLSDYVTTFVVADAARGGLGAVSHVESLEQSVCKGKSGDALSCITCHDPHRPPNPAERAGYFRAKCLGCHVALAERHHPDQPDCTACHMPRRESTDVGHTVVTDHRIPRRATNEGREPWAPGRRLVPFGNARTDARDLGLAYADVAERGDEFARQEALRLLEEARPRYPADPALLTRLGYLYQTRGDLDRAASSYEQALAADPDRAIAAANLGVIYASRGQLNLSLPLWRRAFENNPQLSDLGLNLSRALCAAGEGRGAREVLERVMRHNPDLGAARRLRADLSAGGKCGGP
jgi:Flp pilus assembly protein TadD